MKKLISILFLGFLSVAQADYDKKYAIYGWDVKCVGRDGLEMRLYQSDDDFYADLTEKKGAPTQHFWMQTARFDTRLKTLLFVTLPMHSKGANYAVMITRDLLAKESYGVGELADGDMNGRDLNCYVRYGVDEDDFSEISKKPFPKISVPTVRYNQF